MAVTSLDINFGEVKGIKEYQSLNFHLQSASGPERYISASRILNSKKNRTTKGPLENDHWLILHFAKSGPLK